MLMWHETEICKDDETGEETGETIHGGCNQTIPENMKKNKK